MSEVIQFLTSKEIVMVYIVAVIACVLYFIIHIIDKLYYQKRKQRQNTKELNRLVENINYELAKEREEETSVTEYKAPSVEEAIHIEPVLERLASENDKTPSPVENLSPKEEITSYFSDEKEQVEVSINQPLVLENIVEKHSDNIEELVEELTDVEPQIIAVNNQPNAEIKLEQKEIIEEKTTAPIIEETLDYTNTEPNQTEAQAQLRRLTEALEQAEEQTKNIDLTKYEEMQEKEAIISLEELMKRSKEMYENNELTQYADEGNEPISLEDLERKVKETIQIEEVETTNSSQIEINNIPVTVLPETEEILEIPQEIKLEPVQEKFKMDDFYTIKAEATSSKTAYSQYKSMPIISPVYGIEKQQSTTNIELENTANYEKLDEEIKKTNEFIMTLKELQENLD